MAGQHVLDFTDSNFDSEVAGSDLPVLVDFTATWCGPYHMIAPTVDELAKDTTIVVVKVDVVSRCRR